MSGEVLSAGLGGHGVSVGCSRGGVVSRFLLVVCVAAVLLLGVSSVASAASFYWYGENNSTCWQTGQPGSSSSACDGVGEYFLNSSNPPRMLGGAASTDVELASGSGDYCNAYDIGETLSHTDEIDQSSWTGIRRLRRMVSGSRMTQVVRSVRQSARLGVRRYVAPRIQNVKGRVTNRAVCSTMSPSKVSRIVLGAARSALRRW